MGRFNTSRREFILASVAMGLLTSLPAQGALELINTIKKQEQLSGPFVDFLLDQFDLLIAQKLTSKELVQQVEESYQEINAQNLVSDFINEELEKVEQARVYSKKFKHINPYAKLKLQLFFVKPGTSHPPHAHHNLISVQHIVKGNFYAREYERLNRIDESHLEIKPTFSGPLAPGDSLQTTESHRNIHWFGAIGDEPGIMLNFNIRGTYNDEQLFDPNITAPVGRDFIDPRGLTLTQAGLIVKKITRDQAYTTFTNKTVKDVMTLDNF